MPVLPRSSLSARTRPTSRLESASSVTAASRAIGGLGATAANLGAEMVRKKTDADNAAFITERSNKVMREESERLADIQTRGADVDLKENQTAWNDRVSTALEGAPSEEARGALKSSLDNAYNQKFFPSYSKHQSKMNVRRRVSAVETALDDINSEVLTGRTGVAEAVARSEAAITGLAETSAGVVDIDQLRSSNNDGIVSGALGARIEQGRGGSVISEIKAGKWDKLTTTGTLARILKSAQVDVKQRAAAAQSEFASGLNDYISFVASGNTDQDLAAKYSKQNVNAVMGGKKGAKINEAIDNAQEFGETLDTIKTSSTEELNVLMESKKPTDAKNFGRESREFQVLTKAISARNQEISADRASYGMKVSPVTKKSFIQLEGAIASGNQDQINSSARQYIALQKTVQGNLGVPEQAVFYLPKNAVKPMVEALSDVSGGGEAASQNIEKYTQAFGDDWSNVQRQLIKEGGLKPSISFAIGMPEGEQREQVLEAVSVKEADYVEIIGNDNKKDINDNLNVTLEDAFKTFQGQPGSVRVSNELKSTTKSMAMSLLANGEYDDADTALEAAYDITYGSRFTNANTYRVPADRNFSQIEQGVEAVKMGIKRGFVPILAPLSGSLSNEEDIKEVQLSVLSLTPITEPSGTGIMFVNQNNHSIMDENGEPIVKTWLELEEAGIDQEVIRRQQPARRGSN